METAVGSREMERENLSRIIAEWNANRLDLFELSQPNEDLEFHGVMRYFFQDTGSKVATKCIRVSSTATTSDVIDILVEKFRPDMRMLTASTFAMYEVHANGEERKLPSDERPLFVQLNWNKDDREGRFLLKREDEVTPAGYFESEDLMQNFKRKLTKKEKKEKRKKDRKEARQRARDNSENQPNDPNASMSEKLYTELPESSFTRSISNPEAVMRRRRQQKLEKKLEEFRGKDGGLDSGGMLKVYGETLFPDVPYKTILVAIDDDAGYIVQEALDKYGRDEENASDYCLVKVVVPPGANPNEYVVTGGWGKETILDDDERPLHIIMRYPRNKGSLMFQLKKRPMGYQPRKKKNKKNKNKAQSPSSDRSWQYDDITPVQQDKLPYLLELSPDGNEVVEYRPQVHRIQPNMTEIGTERSSSGQFIQLFSPNIHPRHCVLTNMEGAVTVTPANADAETFINNQKVYETTLLHHGSVLRFGKMHTYRFCDPRAGDMEQKGKFDDILPASLEFKETGEDAFLASIISEVNGAAVHFKLAPTYSLYMACRYRQSPYSLQMIRTPTERAHRMTAFVNKMADMIERTIMENQDVAGALSFWMANASEFLHFLKQDVDLSSVTIDAQDIVAAAIQQAFRYLVKCMQEELEISMAAFLDPHEEADNTDHDSIIDDDRSMDSHQSWRSKERSGRWLMPSARTKHGGRPTLGDVLHTLSSAMTLLRRCRVNAALTIQLFSQLFHFVNMWLFNKIVLEPRLGLCTQEWGARLKSRLTRIESWAEKQGLELAADCHLSRIIQAAHLLQAPKSSADDIASISSTCFKLNSLQLRALLEQYQSGGGEPHIPHQLIDSVVAVAQNTADELTRSDGRDVKLEEDPDLQLPFLLPEDGYSCDIVRGVPNGLQEFLAPLESTGLCRLTVYSPAKGTWTVHFAGGSGGGGGGEIVKSPPGDAFSPEQQQQSPQQQGIPYDTNIPPGDPENYSVKFVKGNTGMGLSIVAAKGVNQNHLGIYIKSVVPGGSASHDGRLRAGDQLLKVNGNSLIGVTQERAAEFMMKSGPHVTLEVAKQGAIFHGLATLLSQPSPIMQRAMPPRQYSGSIGNRPRPKSEDVLGSMRSQNDPRWTYEHGQRDRLTPHREAEDIPRGGYHMQSKEVDKAKSSPNLLNDTASGPDRMRGASTSDLYEKYKQDPYRTLPRDKSKHSSTSNLQPQQVRPGIQQPPPPSDTAMRSKSTSNLDSGPYERNDRSVRPAQSSINVRGYGPPYQDRQQSPSLTRQGQKPATPEVQRYQPSPRQTGPPPQRYGLRPTAAYSDNQPSSKPQTPQSVSSVGSRSYREPEREQPLHQKPYQSPIDTYRPPVHQPAEQTQPPQRTYTPQREDPPPPQRGFPPQRKEPPPAQRGYTSQREEPPPPQQSTFRPTDIYAKPIRPQTQKLSAQQQQQSPPNQQPPQYKDVRSQYKQDVYSSSDPLPPPPPVTSYDNVPSDFPPPPPDLPPPDDDGRNYSQPPPPPTQMEIQQHQPPPPRLASATLERDQRKKELLENQKRWHDEQKARIHEENKVRMREKQRPADIPRAHYGTVPGADPQRNRYSEYIVQQNEKPAQSPNRASAYGDLPVRQPPPIKEKPKPVPAPKPKGFNTQTAAPKVAVTSPGGSKTPVAADQARFRYESSSDYKSPVQTLKKESSSSPVPPSSPSPWEREKKEKEKAAREMEMRRMIDGEIEHLEHIPDRTPDQEERLKTLKMEQQFQQRVLEMKAKQNDDDDDDSDKDIKDTALGRGRLLQMVQQDLEHARQRIEDNDNQRVYYEEEQERERYERQERRLQQLQQEREDQKMRLQQRQDRRDKEQEAWLRKQNEMREQLRREAEESQRLKKLEEERQEQQRVMEEMRQKREAEQAALREIEARREAEERQIRQKEEEMRARHEQQQREHVERERRLEEERRRLESQLQGPKDPNVYYAKPYQPYKGDEDDVLQATVNSYHVPAPERSHIGSSQGPSIAVPPPPQRTSSYGTLERNPYKPELAYASPSGAKKVSFHDTAQSYGDSDYTGSMYRTSSTSSGGSLPSPPSSNYEQEYNTPSNSKNHQTYTTAPTPGVIGTQEIYNDPRARIQAAKDQKNPRHPEPQRMSFRDKMKMFADEIGDQSPLEKPKSSKWELEFMQQHNKSLNGT
uniref:Afadin n=1 Tax=Saccoglossus kowalevskii TaxID=10224 RepID=A0ABM0M1V6_SACKO|nr:PREDICTED: afadin [Saccoglossus kowalevskii]